TIEEIASAIISRIKAIIIIHLFDQANEVYEVSRLCKQKGLSLIEDCAQAHGLFIDGKQHVGNFGDIGTFSFYPTKNLGCMGDGGGIITNNPATAAKVRALRDYGRVDGKFTIDGRNSRMDEMQAAVLRTKLPYLDGWNTKRKKIAERYNQVLKGQVKDLPPLVNNVFYRYLIPVDHETASSGVVASIFKMGELIRSVEIFDRMAHKRMKKLKNLYVLPISPELSENEKTYICEGLKSSYILSK
ncbi:MAG: DegT/DnrJ/EryC1/StrS family aminotransferase, partial [Cyclobacteriaceae bacterium]